MSTIDPACRERFTGLAEVYDAVRPTPPSVVVDVLCEMARAPRPRRVVDLGCGTGLSTRLWLGRADEIIGIEPNNDMRAQAERMAEGISYRAGTSERSGLADGSVDVITCVQALHWMKPAPTFREAARCLRPGGVFAAIDCDWPPFVDVDLQVAWAALHEEAERLIARKGLAAGLRHYAKERHLARMHRSGCFRAVGELAFHRRDQGDARRIVLLAKSQGGLATLLKAHDREGEALLRRFAEVAERVVGDRAAPWTYTYRMRFGVK